MFWGLSQSLDLYSEYTKGIKKPQSESTTLDDTESKKTSTSEELQEKIDSKVEECVQKVENITLQSEKLEEPSPVAFEENSSLQAQENVAAKDELQSSETENSATVQDEAGTRMAAGKEEKSNEGVNDADKLPFVDSLNILLLGAGDVRHILHSIAKRYQHKHPKTGALPCLNFYIVDACMELTARNLALLGIALEQPDVIGMRNRVHLFMDVFGNSLLRPNSHMYLVGKSKALLNMVTDMDELKKRAPYINLDNLKYRERDALENAFEFWQPHPGYVYNIHLCWEQRVRQHIGARYDYRDGAYDWDLNMTLKYRNAEQICSQEYRYWRDTGIAFTFPEYEQCKPNKTLCVGLIRNGEHYRHRGYLGDIQTGPFCAFGLQCFDRRFAHSMHGSNDYRATDVTERNLYEIFHELHTQERYEHPEDWSRKYGSVRLQMGNTFVWNENDLNASMNYGREWLPLEGVQLYYLSPEELSSMSSPNSRWKNYFDVIFVAHSYYTFLKRSFLELLRMQGLLLMETKLLTMVRKEQLVEFERKLKDLAQSGQLDMELPYNVLNTHYSVMKFRRNIAPSPNITTEELETLEKQHLKLEQPQKKEPLKLPELSKNECVSKICKSNEKLEQSKDNKKPNSQLKTDQIPMAKEFEKLKVEMQEMLQTEAIEKVPLKVITRQTCLVDIKESDKCNDNQ